MPLSAPALQTAAEQLRTGRARTPSPIGHLPLECRPSDVDDAMAIQNVLHEMLTADGFGAVAGTKIGCTTQVMQEYLGIAHPCTGAIFERTIQHLTANLEFNSYLHVGVECEIAVTLGKSLAMRDAPHTVDSVAKSVESFHAAIEIVDDRYVDFVARVPDGNTWIADDFFGAGIVLGKPVTAWHDLDLASMHGRMKINGQHVGTGHGRDIINGHPLEALVWLANFEAVRGHDLPAGWIVMLGSVVQTRWVSQGDVIDVNIEGLGTARAHFA